MPFIEGTKCHSKKQNHETSAKCRLRQKHLKFGIKIQFQRKKMYRCECNASNSMFFELSF